MLLFVLIIRLSPNKLEVNWLLNDWCLTPTFAIFQLEVNDTTDNQTSASYLDIHLEIDNGGRFKTKLYDKRDDFTFPIVNFPVIISNIIAAPAFWGYILQFMRLSYGLCLVHWNSKQSSTAEEKATSTRLRWS